MNAARLLAALAAATAAALLLATVAAPVHAQSTLADPVPLSGSGAEAAAANAAMNAQLDRFIPGREAPSAQELARRRAHRQELSACNTAARERHKAGSAQRKAARAQCRAHFAQQKAGWQTAQRRTAPR